MMDVACTFVSAMNHKSILILLVAALALLTSCKKDKDQPGTGNPVFNGKITCEIDGVPWQSSPENEFLVSSDDDTIFGSQAYSDDSYLDIGGCQFSDSSIFFMEIDPLLPGKLGTYEDSTGDIGFAMYLKNINNIDLDEGVYEHTKMKLVITSWDAANRRISGTFEGDFISLDGMETLRIRNGKITNVQYMIE